MDRSINVSCSRKGCYSICSISCRNEVKLFYPFRGSAVEWHCHGTPDGQRVPFPIPRKHITFVGTSLLGLRWFEEVVAKPAYPEYMPG